MHQKYWLETWCLKKGLFCVGCLNEGSILRSEKGCASPNVWFLCPNPLCLSVYDTHTHILSRTHTHTHTFYLAHAHTHTPSNPPTHTFSLLSFSPIKLAGAKTTQSYFLEPTFIGY